MPKQETHIITENTLSPDVRDEGAYSHQIIRCLAHLVVVGYSWSSSPGYIKEYGHEDLFISCNRLLLASNCLTQLAESYGRTASCEFYL